MSENSDLKKRFEKMSDQQLLEIIEEKADDYTGEALTIAQKILAERGGSKKIKEELKQHEKTMEQQEVDIWEKENELKNILRERKRKAIKFKPGVFGILFCILATIFAFLKTFKGIGADENEIMIGKLIAFFLFEYILWGSTFKLFPRSVKKFSIQENQVFFYNAFGTELKVFPTILSVNVHHSNDFLTILGKNKKNKPQSFDIQRKKIGNSNFEQVKADLSEIIDKSKNSDFEYECSNCGAVLKEEDTACPQCGEDVSELDKE